MGSVKKFLPFAAALAVVLTACSDPSTDELREKDPEGYAACIHLGGGLDAPQGVGETNLQKAAAHAAQSATAQLRAAVDIQKPETPGITDLDGLKEACEAQGFDY